MLTGAEIMVRCLEAQGVELIFGYPGAAICPFYDSLYGSAIRHVLVRTEQNAAHAASGYSRTGDKIGVCVATSGPGATNLITGIAAAYMDSIPLIAITGQVRLLELGKDVFQEADVTGACASFVKHSYLVTQAADLPRVLKEAFYIASTGRPGPVLIDVPVDVQTQQVPSFHYPKQVDIVGYKPKTKGHGLQIKKALQAMQEAKRPLLCCGGGVVLAHAQGQFAALAQKSGIPVVSTMMGLGVLPKDTPGFLGMLGSYGAEAANCTAHHADLMILCGVRVADRAIQNPEMIGAKIIHIDIDPAEIGKNIRADIPIVGDLKGVLETLTAGISPMDNTDWMNLAESYRIGDFPNMAVPRQGYVEPKLFLGDLWKRLDKTCILTADVGQGQIWAAHTFRGKRFLVSGGLGAMGYALPAALGAKLANPGAQVLAICGDGAFQMSQCELATAVAEHIPLKLILLDNRRLGMVRELQNNAYGSRHMATHLGGNPDFVKLAQAYGIPAALATNNEEALLLATEMLATQGSYILVCRVDPEVTAI